MSSALLELGFISNDNDNVIFNANVNKYAQAIAVGICKGLGIKYNTNSIDTSPIAKPPEQLFYVWVGKFNSRNDAQNASARIKALSYYNEIREVSNYKGMYYIWVGKFKTSADAIAAGQKVKACGWYNEIRKI